MSYEIREATTPKAKKALHENVANPKIDNPVVREAALRESELLSKLSSGELAEFHARTGGTDRFFGHLPSPGNMIDARAQALEIAGEQLEKFEPNKSK
jgi:hypothetical protein